MTAKIIYEGQPCKRCQTPVIKRTHKANWKPKPEQPYYFDYWFACPNKKCRTIYLVEIAKRWLKAAPEDESYVAFNFATEGL